MMGFETIESGFYMLVVVCLLVFFLKNDEFLFLIISFFYSGALNRYDIIVNKGETDWIYVAYSFNIFDLSDELGLVALNQMFLGTAFFVLSYAVLRFAFPSKTKKSESQQQLDFFTLKFQRVIIVGFFVLLILNSYTSLVLNAVANTYGGVAYGVSYILYFGFAIGGMILLLYLTYNANSKKKALGLKLGYILLFIFAAYTTWDIKLRFRFISWGVSMGILFAADRKPIIKSVWYVLGGTVLAIVFSLAGVLRNQTEKLATKELIERSVDRLTSGEDQNMLDGYMMIMQVYPEHLPFANGMEHFEILLRPIPRALWKDKPVGSYINKLGLNDNMSGETVGISPSLYGSFYAEAGLNGVVIISIIYALIFVMLFRWAESYNSNIRYILKGVIIASTVPLLRGGDLPGVFAFIGMTYWPLMLYMNAYGNFLKADNERLRRVEAAKQYRREMGLLIDEQNSLAVDAGGYIK